MVQALLRQPAPDHAFILCNPPSVQAVIDASKSCTIADECVSMGSYCPWGCNIVVNQAEVNAVWEAMDRYYRSTSYVVCDQVCDPFKGATCQDGQCSGSGEDTDPGDTDDGNTTDNDNDGYSPADGDCDDSDGLVYPGASENCNGVDDNCDGIVDEEGACWITWGRYVFCWDGIDQAGAEAACKARGMHLVVIGDEKENLAVTNQAWKLREREPFWIGLTDMAQEGTFVWVDGSPLVYSAWNNGEPNNAGDEDCVATNWDYGSPGTWNDASCAYEEGYICEEP